MNTTNTRHDLLNAVASLQAQLMLIKRIPTDNLQIQSHIERFAEKLASLQELLTLYMKETEEKSTS